MIRRNGILAGARYCSNVYFIIHNGYLYIGETGGHPSLRWGSHLSNSGTLRVNLRKFENDDINENEEIFFSSIAMDIIDDESDVSRKIARQAVEYEVQRQFYLNSRIFGEELRVVSTVREYPVRHNFKFDPESFAQAILVMVVEQYNTWRLKSNLG